MSAPSGVVTFLFTDIEGSTRRWEADADAMRSALAVHDQVLKAAVEAHHGFLFKHTGDGVIASFASPRSAIDAAIDAQRSLELPVRMGIATGEAALQDGDYFGAVLNRAARVTAAGHGGQILVADSTATLVSGLDFRDLGPRRLRDVPNPVGLYQVRGAHLRDDFPPLRALDTSPGNLRSPTTSLIGRESEIAELIEAVRAHRLVTLTGVGGVGKTRLALEVATHVSDEFPDGIWLFELAAVTDPAAVPDAIASVLGIAQLPGKTLTQSVATALEGRVRLLVFDNCEHVLDATADLVEAVLAQSAAVKVLATSRESVGVADEQLWRVRSLDVGTAVELFIERARSVVQGFSPRESDTVAEICRRLDGIPLAVELAASRMASMTADEVRDRLDHRFRLLVGARRGLERHQTLRHAVQWSYDLLDEPERTLLERCSVFAGGFDLESARAVSGSDDDFTTLDLLDALVRKSLITADRSAGHTRYSMLETIRQFAEEQLASHDDANAARLRHAGYFATHSADIMSVWDSPRQQEAYEWFATESANLRNAFRWAADQGDLNTAAAIATQAGRFGVLVEKFEPVTWAEELIEPACAMDHPRLVSLYAIAALCYMFGRVDDAIGYSRAGELAMQRSPIQKRLGGEMFWLGAVYSATGDHERYIASYMNLMASGHDYHQLSRACVVIALMSAGRHKEAMSLATGIVEVAEATRNPYAISFALLAYGMACSVDDPQHALSALRRGLAVAHDSGNRANVSYLAMAMAMTLFRTEAEPGDQSVALDNITVAIRNYFDAGNVAQIRPALALLVTFLDRQGRLEPAATIAGFASVSPSSAPAIFEFGAAIAHLRDVLGAQTYESLARTGEAMTVATVVAFAYDQIDRVRRELEQLP
jgi:predicted ATPase